MKHSIVHSLTPVLLVGGGDCAPDQLGPLVRRAGAVVAADGGAEVLLSSGHFPDAVIGDMDSLSDAARARLPADRMHEISEQDSTDFDKCLRSIDAPLVWGAGFLGARLDHQLAAMTVLARHPDRRCVLIGAEDVVMLAPPRLSLDLDPGTRFSLYPLGPVSGRSTGLRWNIDGLAFAPDRMTSTSNEVAAPRVDLWLDAPRMLLILPVAAFPELERALERSDARWPAPA